MKAGEVLRLRVLGLSRLWASIIVLVFTRVFHTSARHAIEPH